MIATFAAWIFAAASAGTVAFHGAVIVGAPWGRLTMGGRWPGQLPLPARLLTASSALLLVLLAAVVLAQVYRPAGLPRWAIWGVVVLMGVAVVANAATPSAPERLLWLPVVVVMLACSVTVALARR